MNRLKTYLKPRVHRRLKRLFYKSVDLNMPRLSALILTIMTKRINSRGEKRILYLGSRISLDDINAMAKYSGRYQYSYVERFFFGYILKKFVRYSDINENNYYVDEKYLPGRKETRDYVETMFRHLKVYLRFDALMTSNIGYVDQQELFHISRERGTPVIVLLKEGMVHPRNEDEYFSVYENKRAVCDLFLCYNESIRSCILRQNVSGLSESNMKVTGIPRCDYYVREDLRRTRDQLVFFTFDTDVKFKEVIHDETELARARDRNREFSGYVLELAARRPDLDIVIKTKPKKKHREEMKRIAREYYGQGKFPENLVITDGGSAKDLVLGSKWVLGINNSTTLLEALLVARRIGCPDFSDIIAPEEWDFFSDVETDRQPVTYIRGFADLEAFVEEAGEETPDRDRESEKILSHYFYSTDGKASQRVEKELAALL